METTVRIFKNERFGEVRVTELNGEPYFVAKDVAESLGYKWSGINNVKHVPEEWRGVESVLTPKGNQELIVLSEQGLYFFLGRSDKPSALPYQKWIAGDVTPSIRKNGGYMLAPQEDTPEMIMARALLVAQSTIERHKEQYQLAKATIIEQAPKVEYFNEVLQSESLIPINVIAKQLGMTTISLNNRLHHEGIIYKSGSTWVLYEKYQDKGYTKTKTIPYIDSLGNNKTAIHTYWTESGRLFIHKIMKGGLI